MTHASGRSNVTRLRSELVYDLPGGPYTATQLICASACGVLLWQTAGLWGPFWFLSTLWIRLTVVVLVSYAVLRALTPRHKLLVPEHCATCQRPPAPSDEPVTARSSISVDIGLPPRVTSAAPSIALQLDGPAAASAAGQCRLTLTAHGGQGDLSWPDLQDAPPASSERRPVT